MAGSTDTEASGNERMTEGERRRAAVDRVRNLSIFFVGVGLFAVAGLVLNRTDIFVEYQLTYFAVGGAVGAVGLLLWLLTR